jgi:hypothetical protein
MGFLSSLFGTDKKNDMPEGLWLKHEREGHWSEIASFGTSQPIEVNTDSCFSGAGGTYCVLRSFNAERQAMLYMGCIVPDEQDQFIIIAVDRAERRNGSVVKGDDWTKNRVLSYERIPSIKGGIQITRNLARFNGYSNPPPFVMHIMFGLGRD